MQFKLVAFGIALLIIGLVAYASIPAVHTLLLSMYRTFGSKMGFPFKQVALSSSRRTSLFFRA
jgi:hypothetical protein